MAEICFNDNIIYKEPYKGTKPEAEHFQFHFESQYEVEIKECEIIEIFKTTQDDIELYSVLIDLVGTEAQATLSDFVTDVALVSGLDKRIDINNMILLITPNILLSSSIGQDVSCIDIISDDLYLLDRCNCNVVLEWPSYQIRGKDIKVELNLTEITLNHHIDLGTDCEAGSSNMTEDTDTDIVNTEGHKYTILADIVCEGLMLMNDYQPLNISWTIEHKNELTE
jgi:hypothetical protein